MTLVTDQDPGHSGSDEREPLLSSRPDSPPPAKASLHWWTRPSVWWVIPLAAIQMVCLTMTVAPMLELLTRMACKIHRPDIGIEHVHFPNWRDAPLETGPVPLPFPSMPWVLGSDSSPHKPTKGELCDADEKVNQAIASLMTADSVGVGIINMAVTGWWSARSDMWGRRPVCALATLAGILTMGGMIFVTKFGDHLPGHQYWWVLPADIIAASIAGGEGSSLVLAYLSDATEPANRASTFAMFGGLMMGAVAIGPIIGAQMIHHTGNLLSVYYVGLMCTIFTALMWIFVVPESLSAERRAASARKYYEERRSRTERLAAARAGAVGWRKIMAFLMPSFLIELVEPLSVLLPQRRQNGLPGREWGLTILAGSFFCILVSAGSMTFYLQLAKKLFGWGAEELGYWVSAVGTTRAIFLLAIFPAVVRFFKPKPVAQDNSVASDATTITAANVTYRLAVTRFDLLIVRTSLAIDVLASLSTALSVTSGQWLIATALGAFGAGLGPSIKSLALVLAPGTGTNADGPLESETGKVLGALGVLSSFGTQVLGSAIFGVIYHTTVGVFPRAIIVASTVMQFIGLLGIMFIRVPGNAAVAS